MTIVTGRQPYIPVFGGAEHAIMMEMGTLPDVALAFARECLGQENSRLIEGGGRRFCPHSTTSSVLSPSVQGRGKCAFSDLTDVMQIVSYWCSLNELRLDLSFDEVFDRSSYSCRIENYSDDGKLYWLVEGPHPDICYDDLTPCGDACYALLAASVEAARALKRPLRRKTPRDQKRVGE